MFGREDDEERLWKAHLDDSPMGIGNSDYHDKVRATISRLKESGCDLSSLTHYDVRSIEADPDFKFSERDKAAVCLSDPE